VELENLIVRDTPAEKPTKKAKKAGVLAVAEQKIEPEIAEKVSTKLPEQEIRKFKFWLVGQTPLITHAWSEKAKRDMLDKQQKTASAGKDARDPEADFLNSLYEMSPGLYGFPATAVKKCLLSAAHKDKGAPRTVVQGALWLNAELVRTRPALAGAVCDMPLIRIYGAKPEMREDMVRIGAGLKKTASLAYRAQFFPWAIRVVGKLNVKSCPLPWLPFLARESGMSTGIGDWRTEKSGMFGAFHPATVKEQEEWEAYAAGRGPLPTVEPEDLDDDDDYLTVEAAE
jgi:hypothetical protein